MVMKTSSMLLQEGAEQMELQGTTQQSAIFRMIWW